MHKSNREVDSCPFSPREKVRMRGKGTTEHAPTPTL
jgi:hypothetical protein